jgi:lipopolysaccharide biosynthesis protein
MNGELEKTKRFPRILIHAHVFYLNLWDELLECINNYFSVCEEKHCIDVFLTYPEDDKEILEKLKLDLPKAVIISVCNRGYDIGPFIEVLHHVDLNQYDYIVKLHTKRNLDNAWVNYRCYNGNEWRRELLSFCSTKENVKQTMDAFSKQADLGMIASSKMIDPSGMGSCHHSLLKNDAILELGIKTNPKTVVWGTMFMVRASLFKPFLKWTISDFDFAPGRNTHEHIINGLTFIAECAFGKVVEGQGYRISNGRGFVWANKIESWFKLIVFTLLRYASDGVRLLKSKCINKKTL